MAGPGDQAGVLFQLLQDLFQMAAIGPGQHKPQVVVMFAGVVVIDLGVASDARRHLLQALGGHRQGGEGTGAGAAVIEYRPDPRQRARQFQALQAGHQLCLAAAQGVGHLQVRLGAQRHAMLIAVDQACGQFIQFHLSTPFLRAAAEEDAAGAFGRQGLEQGQTIRIPNLHLLAVANRQPQLLTAPGEFHVQHPGAGAQVRDHLVGLGVEYLHPVVVRVGEVDPQLAPVGARGDKIGWPATAMAAVCCQVRASITST